MIFSYSYIFKQVLRNKLFNIIFDMNAFFMYLLPLCMMNHIKVCVPIVFKKFSFHFICSCNFLLSINITINIMIGSIKIQYDWIFKFFIYFYFLKVIHIFKNIPLLERNRLEIFTSKILKRTINFLFFTFYYQIIFKYADKDIFLKVVTFFLQNP